MATQKREGGAGARLEIGGIIAAHLASHEPCAHQLRHELDLLARRLAVQLQPELHGRLASPMTASLNADAPCVPQHSEALHSSRMQASRAYFGTVLSTPRCWRGCMLGTRRV